MSERRSRWDKAEPPPPPSSSGATGSAPVPVTHSADEAKKKALEAVARLNLLMGGEQAASSATLRASQEPVDDWTVERMGINHLPGPKRFQLTKKATVEDCRERFGVYAVVKGVYQPPDAPPDLTNEPIYLELRGPSLSTVNACLKYLKDLLLAEDAAPAHSGKVYVPVPAKSPFNVVAKIVGPSGEFVKHIKKQANCQVQIAGKDCGVKQFENDDELHIRLDAHSAEGLAKAKQLTQDLVDHVMQQYDEWLASLPPAMRPPGPFPQHHQPAAFGVPSPAALRPNPPPSSSAAPPPPPPPPSVRPPPPPPPPQHPPPPPPPPSAAEPDAKRARH